MKKTILAATALAALALSLGIAPARAHSGVEIDIGPNGFSIEIGKRRHRQHHDHYQNYQQPTPYIDVVVYEQVEGWEDEWAYDRWGNQYRTGRKYWTTRSVPRNVRAFWDRGAYWYYDSRGRLVRYR